MSTTVQSTDASDTPTVLSTADSTALDTSSVISTALESTTVTQTTPSQTTFITSTGEQLPQPAEFPTGIVAGATVAVVVIAILIAVLTILWRRGQLRCGQCACHRVQEESQELPTLPHPDDTNQGPEGAHDHTPTAEGGSGYYYDTPKSKERAQATVSVLYSDMRPGTDPQSPTDTVGSSEGATGGGYSLQRDLNRQVGPGSLGTNRLEITAEALPYSLAQGLDPQYSLQRSDSDHQHHRDIYSENSKEDPLYDNWGKHLGVHTEVKAHRRHVVSIYPVDNVEHSPTDREPSYINAPRRHSDRIKSDVSEAGENIHVAKGDNIASPLPDLAQKLKQQWAEFQQRKLHEPPGIGLPAQYDDEQETYVNQQALQLGARDEHLKTQAESSDYDEEQELYEKPKTGAQIASVPFTDSDQEVYGNMEVVRQMTQSHPGGSQVDYHDNRTEADYAAEWKTKKQHFDIESEDIY